MTASVATTWGNINGVWTTSDAENLPLAQVSLANGIRDLINGYQGNYSTVALLLATTPAANSWATADNAPGARFQYVAGVWVMSGTPRFATSTARNTALTAPGAGWLSRIDTESFVRRATGSGTTWLPYGASAFTVTPTLATGGTITSSGLVTVSGASSLILDGIASSEFRRTNIIWSLTLSGASAVVVNLRAGGVTNTASVYDRQVLSGVSATAAAAQSLASASWALDNALAGIHEMKMQLSNMADAAAATTGTAVHGFTTNPMTTTAGAQQSMLLHRTSAAYDGLYLSTTAGTFTGWVAYEVQAF